MSHNIQLRDTQQGIKQAWHKKTEVVEKITRENVVFSRYGLQAIPLQYQFDGKTFPATGSQIVATDDGLPVGEAISDTYQIISNMEFYEMAVDALTGTPHQLVSAGTVANRAKGFLSFALDGEFTAANRITNATLNFLWGHGNGIPGIAKSGFIVTVCENTFEMSLSEKGEFVFRVSHHKFAAKKISNMGEAVERHFGVTKEFSVAMESFANAKCDEGKASRIYAGFLGGDKLSTRSANAAVRMVELFKTGKGNRGENMADLFNGATDYYSHESSGGAVNSWKQFQSSQYGAGSRMKTQFFNILRDKKATKEVEKRGESLLLDYAKGN